MPETGLDKIKKNVLEEVGHDSFLKVEEVVGDVTCFSFARTPLWFRHKGQWVQVGLW